MLTMEVHPAIKGGYVVWLKFSCCSDWAWETSGEHSHWWPASEEVSFMGQVRESQLVISKGAWTELHISQGPSNESPEVEKSIKFTQEVLDIGHSP